MAYLTKCEAATAITVTAASVIVFGTGIGHGDIGLKMAPDVWESLFKVAAIIGAGVFFCLQGVRGLQQSKSRCESDLRTREVDPEGWTGIESC